MDLLATLGFASFGQFLGGFLSNILANRTDLGLNRLGSLLSARLADGRLPANHDLRAALTGALRSALRNYASALADGLMPGSPLLAEIRHQLSHPAEPRSRAALLGLPLWTEVQADRRRWVEALLDRIDDPAALARLASASLGESPAPLLDGGGAGAAASALHAEVARWLDAELGNLPGRPARAEETLRDGWLLADGRAITLFQAWCLFFREEIKHRPAVFRIYVAETLAQLRPAGGPALPEPSLDRFRDYLAGQYGELRDAIERGFAGLDGHLDRQDAALADIAGEQRRHGQTLAQLRDLFRLPALAALWRESRGFRYGLYALAALLLLGLAAVGWEVHRIPDEVAHTLDPAALTARLRTEIEQRYERDAEAARREGKPWEGGLRRAAQSPRNRPALAPPRPPGSGNPPRRTGSVTCPGFRPSCPNFCPSRPTRRASGRNFSASGRSFRPTCPIFRASGRRLRPSCRNFCPSCPSFRPSRRSLRPSRPAGRARGSRGPMSR